MTEIKAKKLDFLGSSDTFGVFIWLLHRIEFLKSKYMGYFYYQKIGLLSVALEKRTYNSVTHDCMILSEGETLQD